MEGYHLVNGENTNKTEIPTSLLLIAKLRAKFDTSQTGDKVIANRNEKYKKPAL